MAALALWAKGAGIKVMGSDTTEEFPTDIPLKKAKIKILTGFKKENISQFHPQLVIYTGAHEGEANPEVKAGQELGIPTLPHGKALGLAMASKRQISVAGSHGKTTTAAMIATILATAGYDPSYCVGCGEIFGIGGGGRYGRGDWFVAEADEYVTDPGHDPTPRFLWQQPEILVVTNIDYDHPDVYRSLAEVQEAFLKLVRQQQGLKLAVVNVDDPASSILLTPPGGNVITYGFSPRANFQISRVSFAPERTFFSLVQNGVSVGEFSLKVPGKHNAANAVAAIAVTRAVGFTWSQIRQGLLNFDGTKRRFEKIGRIGSTILYDDYAHHPREITATLLAARQWYPQRRLITVFQPHTYSRTKALLPDFAQAFGQSDIVMITQIYASAREHEDLGMTGEKLTREIAKYHPHVLYARDLDGVVKIITQTIKANDIILLAGAGNIYTWGRKILERIKLKT